MSEKTEQPTPRRLERARREGDSAVSSALVQTGALLVAVVLLPAFAVQVARRTETHLVHALSGHTISAPHVFLATEVARLVIPWLAACALLAAVVGALQTGGVFATRRIAPDLARLNPAGGLGKLVSRDRWAHVARAVVGAAAMVALLLSALEHHAAAIVNTTGQPGAALGLVGTLVSRLVWAAVGLMVVLACVDWLVTRGSWLRRLRMSVDEIRREAREADGNPEVKAARHRQHRELLEGSALNALRSATVLIVNPTHLATALRYDADGEGAPLIVAHGRGDLAQRMIKAAHHFGVPVVRDVPVARTLAELALGDEIPEALYEAVAEILRELGRGDSAPDL